MQVDFTLVFQALVGAASGVGFVKFIEYMGQRRKYQFDADQSAIDDWRTEAQTLRKENRDLSARIDVLGNEHAQCLAKTAILEATVERLQREIESLRASKADK